jgi:hypothetical protein
MPSDHGAYQLIDGAVSLAMALIDDELNCLGGSDQDAGNTLGHLACPSKGDTQGDFP